MSEFTIKQISYKELREKPLEFKDDRYGIAAFLTKNVRNTFLACPGIKDETDSAVILLLDGDIVIGRELRFGTRLKVGDEIVWARSGCALEVVESYRKSGAGTLIMTTHSSNKKEDPVSLTAFFSTIRVKLLKKQKWTVFEIPQYIKLTNTRLLFESFFRFKGSLLNVSSKLGNGLLSILDFSNTLKRRKLLKKYIIKKETIVPEWAGELATNDGHKYMEYHDVKWLQWNLDYNMNGLPQDKQSFYAVYDKSGNPYGFFMTKERFEGEAGRYKNIVRGTIVEWATSKKDELTEADLNLLAISTFSSATSHINTVTVDPATGKQLIKMGFRSHGTYQISFKDNKKGQYADGCDQSLWRIRYGCCNSIVF